MKHTDQIPSRTSDNRVLKRFRASFNEYVEHSKENHKYDGSSNKDGSSRFYGDTTCFDEMYQRCFDGYNAHKVADRKADLAKEFYSESIESELGVVGDDLDIARWVEGRPDCWWSDEPTPCKPLVHIIADTCANCDVGGGNFVNHGGALALLCELVEEVADVRISTFNGAERMNSECDFADSMELKGYDEPLDIPRIGAVTHPSFFRRISFGIFEAFDAEAGYGYRKEWSKLMSEEDFYEWMGIEKGTNVVMFDSPSHHAFGDVGSTRKYVERMFDDIQKMIIPDHAQA